MKIKHKLTFWSIVLILFGAILTLAYDFYPALSKSFGIIVTIKDSYINSIIINLSKLSANSITIKPISGNIDVYIPPNSFASDLSFTLATKSSFPSSDRPTVKLSGVGISIATVPVLQPSRDLTITIRYRSQDIMGLDEDKLAISRYDEPSGKWLVLRSTVYKSEKKVTALTNHLSIFAIIQTAASVDLNSIKVYPNPWYPAAVPQGVAIDGLTKTAEIKIYTVVGELVTVLNEADGNGRIVWNGKNSEGGNVGSGIYIAVVKNEAEIKRIKIGVVR